MLRIGAGGIFLNTKGLSNQPLQITSSYNPTLFQQASTLIDIISKINANLDNVIPIMEEKTKIRKMADNRNPNYAGAVAEFSWLPGYIIKLDADARIKGGEYLKKYIMGNKLDLLQIPEQYLYTIPENYHQHTLLRTLCIGKKIEGIQGKDIPLHLNQIKQLIRLILETGVADLKWRNLVHIEEGKIAIIDTETFWGKYYGLHSLLDNALGEGAELLIREEIDNLWSHNNRQ